MTSKRKEPAAKIATGSCFNAYVRKNLLNYYVSTDFATGVLASMNISVDMAQLEGIKLRSRSSSERSTARNSTTRTGW